MAKQPPKKPVREQAFIIRKLSLSEWQRIDVVIEDGVVVERIEHEPNLSAIVSKHLSFDIARND